MTAWREHAIRLVEQLRGRDFSDAYHRLLEADCSILPFLVACFREEESDGIRGALVEIIWQHRVPSTLPFLAEVLRDSSATVWQAALDGLVTFGSDDARKAIELELSRRGTLCGDASGFAEYAQEALEQIHEASKTTPEGQAGGGS